MPKANPKPKKRRLCGNCQVIADSPTIVMVPPYLVHPEGRGRNLFGALGRAVCPHCGVTWHRGPNGVSLVQ
jgi:hypothetical protein